MFKLNTKSRTIVEISNAEFANDFKLKSPNIVVSVLSGNQSIARLDDSFYSTELEDLEYLRDDSDMVERCQLEMFTLNSISFFGESQSAIFSNYMISQLVDSQFREWPFISNLLPLNNFGRIQPAYDALLKNDASEINVFSICESILNKKCGAFSLMNVLDALQKIETADVDQLLDLQIELPNNLFLKISSPVGLLHSSKHASNHILNGVFVDSPDPNVFVYYRGRSVPFRANRSDELCDLTNNRFLITSVYSHTSGFISSGGIRHPISSMIYVLEGLARTQLENHLELLLNAHKYLLKDHFLRLVVCDRSSAEDPISSFLPTNAIFRGVDTGIKDMKSLIKFQDFLENTSPYLKQSMILQPQLQTAMDVTSDLLTEVYTFYVQNAQLRKETLDTLFLQHQKLQINKTYNLKDFCLIPRYSFPTRN